MTPVVLTMLVVEALCPNAVLFEKNTTDPASLVILPRFRVTDPLAPVRVVVMVWDPALNVVPAKV